MFRYSYMHISTISLIWFVEYIGIYELASMGYQWVSISGSTPLKDFRYYLAYFACGICSAVKSHSKMTLFDSLCEFLVSVSANIG